MRDPDSRRACRTSERHGIWNGSVGYACGVCPRTTAPGVCVSDRSGRCRNRTSVSAANSADSIGAKSHNYRYISSQVMNKRSMPVCFTKNQYKAIEEYARRHGMLNAGQALERILDGRA